MKSFILKIYSNFEGLSFANLKRAIKSLILYEQYFLIHLKGKLFNFIFATINNKCFPVCYMFKNLKLLSDKSFKLQNEKKLQTLWNIIFIIFSKQYDTFEF